MKKTSREERENIEGNPQIILKFQAAKKEKLGCEEKRKKKDRKKRITLNKKKNRNI